MFTEILMPPGMGLSAMDLACSEGEPGKRARMELNWGCCHRQGDVRGRGGHVQGALQKSPPLKHSLPKQPLASCKQKDCCPFLSQPCPRGRGCPFR